MPELLTWLTKHWVSVLIAAALLVACVFVYMNRTLFLKE